MPLLGGNLLGCLFFFDTISQIFIVVVKRNVNQIFIALLTEFIAGVGIGNIVRHHYRPLDSPHERIQLVVLVPKSVQTCDKTAHTCSRDDIDRNPKLFHILDDAKVRKTSCASSGKDESYRRAVLAD